MSAREQGVQFQMFGLYVKPVTMEPAGLLLRVIDGVEPASECVSLDTLFMILHVKGQNKRHAVTVGGFQIDMERFDLLDKDKGRAKAVG